MTTPRDPDQVRSWHNRNRVGGETPGQIAKTDGVTRNTVIGALRRYRKNHKLATTMVTSDSRPTVCEPPKPPLTPRRAIPAPRPVPAAPVPRVIRPGQFQHSFQPPSREFAICEGKCLWIDDDKQACCAERVTRSYCAEHAAKVYRPPKETHVHA